MGTFSLWTRCRQPCTRCRQALMMTNVKDAWLRSACNKTLHVRAQGPPRSCRACICSGPGSPPEHILPDTHGHALDTQRKPLMRTTHVHRHIRVTRKPLMRTTRVHTLHVDLVFGMGVQAFLFQLGCACHVYRHFNLHVQVFLFQPGGAFT